MADRYWVGGTGNWSSTSRWSTTSGGASGASVPVAADNVIFDANSGSGAAHYTVTIPDATTCASFTFTPVATDGVTQFAIDGRFVVNGVFSTSGTQGNRRAWFRSGVYGLTRDMQVASFGSVSDMDFRDIRITGAAGALSGTRLGDLRGTIGINFNVPKTVYRVGTGLWSDNRWSDTSGGTASTDFFPLAQDTAVFNESTSAGTHTMNSAIPYTGTVSMGSRTTALSLALSSSQTLYGNLTLGSGVSVSGSFGLTFSGRNTQIITSAGKILSGSVTVDSYGGTVELGDALDLFVIGELVVTNGTFDTKNMTVRASRLSSSGTAVRSIKLGSSTVTLTGATAVSFSTPTNLTFDAGTSSLDISAGSLTTQFEGGGLVFYDVSFTSGDSGITSSITGNNTFRNLTFTGPASAGLSQYFFFGDQTITGSLSSTGTTAVRRIMFLSGNYGVTRTLTVGTLSTTDCDFRDITLAGTAAGSSPVRAGNCGGNSGITFPSPKTVYWNLSGSQNWSATGWATSSGGTPAVNNFPLAQDTAVFDDTGSAGTVALQTFNVGSVNMSARTSAMTLTSAAVRVHGSWSFGTGVTSSSSSATISFLGRGTSTITSGGVAFGCNITVDCITGVVQLADALSISSSRILTLTSGTFDAVSYNVTSGLFRTGTFTSPNTRTLKMGSGTWTLSGVGAVWDISSSLAEDLNLYCGSANILLSDTSSFARSFDGSGSALFSFNKLTIGGSTGTSTLTISGNNQFTELASSKTVAHTIALGTTTQTFGAWTVTGSAGNVVTLTGTGTSHVIAGACVSGVDYLAMGSIGFSSNSPGEFYAGSNSTGTAGAPVYRTAKPADSVRYWVGGTGNWSDTNRWSTSSGGSGGASIPRSHDSVVFDSASNATAYSVTVDAVTGGQRCKALTVSGPASGNVTLSSNAFVPLNIHDDVLFAATGVVSTIMSGGLVLTGSNTGRTFTTNGVALTAATAVIRINGVGCGWSLGSAANLGDNGGVDVVNGSFSTANYNLTAASISSDSLSARSVSLGSSTITTSGFNTPVNLGNTESARAALTFNAGTSQLNMALVLTFNGNNQTFYNASLTGTSASSTTFNGANTFNNLSVAGLASSGLRLLSFSQNQTISGTFTVSAGVNATARNVVQSSVYGTSRTLTCAAVSLTDADFRDITIAGAAAPASGTRLGNCAGNSGITFNSGTNKYWSLVGGGNWSSTAWSTTSGGTPAANNFPLVQDTCIIEVVGLNSGATITIDAAYNIGTIDMSARTSSTMTLACSQSPFINGNWVNGTGTTLSGTGTLTFAGRTSQTITNASRVFTQTLTVDSPGGSVTLQDAFQSNRSSASALTLTRGTFNANNYGVTLSGAAGGFSSSSSETRTLALGSGTWTFSGTGGWNTATSTNLTVTGTATIRLSSASSKSFQGGGVSYSGVTLDQGGAGTLTVSGNNTFANITNSYSSTGATTINFGTSTQRVANFTAAGELGRVLTLQGFSAGNPCALVYTGIGELDLDFLSITGVRAYPVEDTWMAGDSSSNNGSLGWVFNVLPTSTGSFFLLF